MKIQQQQRKPVSGAIINSVNPETFVPMRLTTKALNDDSCWEESELDFEESLPSYASNSFGDDDY